MSMIEWAEKEVEIACKRERGDGDPNEWDYGCACYESALKAFKSLCEDGHSGMSIGFTKNILVRLIEGKPLTPIEDVEENWRERGLPKDSEIKAGYQCIRMSSLFKDVYEDGTVKYSDIDRVVSYDLSSPDVPWSNGFIRNLIDEMFPITMPYVSKSRPYEVYCEEFLVDEKNGDFDTMGVLYVVTPDGEKINICRYFKDGENSFIEIDKSEYEERKKN